MWKSLRIGALLALLALGALKLAQYSAAGSQIDRLAGALAPSLKLTYADVTGALDGRVIVGSPRIEVVAGPARGAVIRAARATIEPDGTFWLLRRAITGDASVPASLNLRLEQTAFSEPRIDHIGREGWFGLTSLVPFESLGCGTPNALSLRDYVRMGLAVRSRQDDIRYAYDAGERALRIDLVTTSAPFATLTTHLELSQFAPSAWLGDATAAKAQRIEQFSLNYADGGYLAKRNRFCAQLAGIDSAVYADVHLQAVRNFLAARGITAGEEVEALYRKLVIDGGSAELSSLPDAAFVPSEFATAAPEALLRQLNMTLRRNTAPPILMRLAFADPSPDANASDAALATVDTAGANDEDLLGEDTPAEAPSESQGMPLLASANAAPLPMPATPRIELPLPAPAETVAVLPAVPEPIPSPPESRRPELDPRNSVEAIPASAPPPPADSTLALVWRAPTIERLPPRSTPSSEYASIPVGSIGERVGSRVRLTTVGGKRVEGRVQQVDGLDVVVAIQRDGGIALMRIPRAGILEAGIRRSVSAR